VNIFWLTIDELEQALIAGEAVGVKLPVIVEARKATYQTYAETPLPFNLQESQIFSIELGQGLLADVVVGLPISPGHIRGTIKVLHSPADFQPGQENIILVMPTTDPAWLPLLHSAAGLIVEMGGLLSHGSIIAREYGVPGVANIPQATKHFHDGEVVLLDGSTGVVQRLARADRSEVRGKYH
jgi:pyruvate,water dikinase